MFILLISIICIIQVTIINLLIFYFFYFLVQWMTAGRGIVHSEMPAGEGVQNGLQLWINLSSRDKMYETNANFKKLSRFYCFCS